VTDIILHHYETSPFAKKIRAILGFKKAEWQSVDIPRVMPKPDVVALTGGYRRTPVLQVGADIYCDTALIARKIDALMPSPPLFDTANAATANALAQWADTTLFQHTVPLAFQKHVIAQTFAGNEDLLKVFVKDRAAMSQDAPRRRILPEEATVLVNALMTDLNNQLCNGRQFLLGDEACIADFSVYHPLWFLQIKPIVCELFNGFEHLNRWMQIMADLGEGSATPLSSEQALEIANQSNPAVLAGTCDIDGFAIGDAVTVTPGDYGFDPVAGTLIHCDQQQVAIARTDPRAGDVVVHFPRLVYDVRKQE